MNSAEQTVTWLITLGVLESPKKSISDPEAFLQASLQDGAVLCRLLERLRPGTVDKPFEVNDLLQGLNFSKVLNSLVALNKATEGKIAVCVCVCVRESNICSISDMSEGSGCGQLLVRARFPFQQTNEDELSFSKGDLIIVTRQEEGGWWEGTLKDKTGWFPSNYVRELKGNDKPKSGTLKSPPKGFDTTIINKTYYNVVLQNILEAETEYSRELQSLLGSYLRPLHPTDRMKLLSLCATDILGLRFYPNWDCHVICVCRLPESQQRIGGFFLGLIPQMKKIYLTYCSNHPSAVNVLTQHSEELKEYMESKGAPPPGILALTTSLSKPFIRLDRYPTLLKELDRHMEDQHPDRADLQASMTAFKNLSAQCKEIRKKKELVLQILTEPIRNWEGDDIRTLGPVLHMSQAAVRSQNCQESNECYLLLFHHTLLMVSASLRMSGFIYQGRIPLSGMLISRIEDGENLKNAFEISGSQGERIQVACNSQHDLQEWLDLLTKHTHAPAASTHKTLSVCHTVSRPMWGPLEPPSTPKPWSLSCLRPAPPLRPSAALCYKEDMSKSPKNVKKLLPKRKPERKPSEEDFTVRKSTAALEEDAQILKVIEAYCTSAKTRQTLNSSSSRKDVQVLFPEEEKIIVEEMRSNGQTVVEERSLVDTVYSLKDEVQELKQDNKRMKRTLEEEQRARKELERIVRRVLKNMNDPTWDETNL
uniref:Rho guanine nucleotide exchange factor (GEF) 7b n=1 Tax=Oreochromis niloticus TaxID=8128 RepID=A0A669CFC6_ORENI